MNNKNTILIISVLLIGLCVIGGTYAWLTANVNVTNGTYSGFTDCFLIDYTDNTQTITGTMFPGSGPTKGLSGSVSMKINSSCTILGDGSIYLHINNGTSTRFGTTASAHCENPNTLVTLPNYTTSSTCSSGGGSWVTNGKVFKYAVYDNASGTGTPLRAGYFDSSKIGDEMLLYNGFQVNTTQKTFYIFFWLDGYVTDNTYVELPFDGYIVGRAKQTE